MDSILNLIYKLKHSMMRFLISVNISSMWSCICYIITVFLKGNTPLCSFESTRKWRNGRERMVICCKNHCVGNLREQWNYWLLCGKEENGSCWGTIFAAYAIDKWMICTVNKNYSRESLGRWVTKAPGESSTSTALSVSAGITMKALPSEKGF